MGVSVSYNSKTFVVPEAGDRNWAGDTSGLLQELASAALSKAGGTYTLTNDVDFGGSFGVKALKGYFNSIDRRTAGGALALRGEAAVGNASVQIDSMAGVSDGMRMLDVVGTGGNVKLRVMGSGRIDFPAFGNSSASPGNATLNTPAGLSAIANGAAAVTITNNLVTANSLVFAILAETDGSIYVKSVVPGAGSFVINISANATGDRTVAWIVFN